MKLNIVTVNSGWILQKIAQRIAANNQDTSVEIVVTHNADDNADVNYYCDLQNCYRGQKTKLDIAYFTHADRNDEQWLINLLIQSQARNLAGIISMNKRYTDMLEKVGFPKERLTTITPGETYNQFPLKKIKLGIVSRGGYEGYGQYFIENLLYNYDFTNFELHFLGNGWDNLIPIASGKGITLLTYSDNDYSFYPKFYQFIDYLLIPGMWTAGPMSMQEALSTGIPVIGADIGFVNYEFKADYVFEPGNVAQLINILKSIEIPIINRRKQVQQMRWSTYTADTIKFIQRINDNINQRHN